jgi:hypothetical protein
MLGPWQTSHPLVMPLWLNCEPLKVVIVPLAPASGISMLGMLLVWQLSQPSEPIGMCAGVRLDVFGVTPSKVPAVTLAPWQLAQLPVIPLWLNAELLNLAVSPTGSVRLELEPTWHVSHAVVPNGMWLEVGALIVKLAAGIAKLAAALALWHCAQLLLVDCALAWIADIAGITEKSGLVWQFAQLAEAENGMWFVGMEGAVKSVNPPWQFEHSPVVGCLESATKNCPLTLCGRVWKPLNGALVVIGYCPMLIHT